jgi:hypothetical protein
MTQGKGSHPRMHKFIAHKECDKIFGLLYECLVCVLGVKLTEILYRTRVTETVQNIMFMHLRQNKYM